MRSDPWANTKARSNGEYVENEHEKIDMGIFICFMDICLAHSGIDFDRILYPDTGEDKEYVLNAKYRLD